MAEVALIVGNGFDIDMGTFDFIHTKKIYSGIKEDEEKWNGMMNRLMAKDRHGI